MLNDQQVRNLLFAILDDTKQKRFPWKFSTHQELTFRQTTSKYIPLSSPESGHYIALVDDYTFKLFPKTPTRKTVMFAILKQDQVIYLTWARKSYLNSDLILLLEYELVQK